MKKYYNGLERDFLLFYYFELKVVRTCMGKRASTDVIIIYTRKSVQEERENEGKKKKNEKGGPTRQ